MTMSNEQVKAMVDAVASELSMQGFALEHEVALRGAWEQAALDPGTLYAVAAKLQDCIAALLAAASATQDRIAN